MNIIFRPPGSNERTSGDDGRSKSGRWLLRLLIGGGIVGVLIVASQQGKPSTDQSPTVRPAVTHAPAHPRPTPTP